MQPKATQQIALHQGQALALCWLLQQPLRAGGEVLAGITRTLAFSRPLSGTDWAAVPPPLGVHLDLSTRLSIDALIAPEPAILPENPRQLPAFLNRSPLEGGAMRGTDC